MSIESIYYPSIPWMIKITNAQIMTEGIEHQSKLPQIDDIIYLDWLLDVDAKAEYEINKNQLTTKGRVLRIENLVKFYLVTVELLHK